jgi:hypothetical protein
MLWVAAFDRKQYIKFITAKSRCSTVRLVTDWTTDGLEHGILRTVRHEEHEMEEDGKVLQNKALQ